MELCSLRLVNFRNFRNFTSEFGSEVTVVVGLNGVGKSNLLEAASLLAAGKSFRAASNAQFILSGEGNAIVEGVFAGEGRTSFKLNLYLSRSSRRFLLNGKVCGRQEFLTRFPAVFFTPRHLDVITGGPSLRRQFLDEVLSGAFFDYGPVLSKYRQVLRQRNRLLALGGATAAEIIYWDDQLIRLGSFIIQRRKVLVDEFNKYLSDWGIGLDYYPSPRVVRRSLGPEGRWHLESIADLVEEKIKEIESKERKLGFTLIGPQRDELKIWGPINRCRVKEELAFYGSRGQQRLAVVRLKMAQVDWLEDKVGERPVLLLDDVFSELDKQSRVELLPFFEKQQTVITAVELPEELEDVEVLTLGKG